jgi:hypothetical protein
MLQNNTSTRTLISIFGLGKKAVIYSLILTQLCSNSSVATSQSIEEKIENIHNPFQISSTKPKAIKKTKNKSITINAIIDNSLLFKDNWYKKGEKIANCTILKINKFDAKIVCKDGKIKELKVNK